MNVSSEQKQNKKNRKSMRYSQRFKNGVIIGSVFAMGLAGIFKSDKHLSPSNDISNDFPVENAVLNVDAAYKESAVTLLNTKEAFRLAKFNVDTVVIDTAYIKKKFRVFGNYSSVTKSVTVNYFKLDTTGMPQTKQKREQAFADKNNSKEKVYSILIHEGTHELNDKEGLKDFGINPYQMAKICIHDEITANINELLEMRDNYLKTKDINAINPQYAFYRNALKNKNISPDISKIPEEKELALIIDGMIEWWCKANQDYYEKAHIAITTDWVKSAFMHDLKERATNLNLKKRHNKEYAKRLKKAYSFKITLVDKNGKEKTALVNFAHFMQKDVDISDNFKSVLKGLKNRSFKQAYRDYKDTRKKQKNIQYWSQKKVNNMDKSNAIIKERNLTEKSVLLEKSPKGVLIVKNKSR